jgi:hypothetical protein
MGHVMTDTPSRDEIASRIAALLTTRRTGQDVADYLERQSAEQSRQASVAAPPARRLEQRMAGACSNG